MAMFGSTSFSNKSAGGVSALGATPAAVFPGGVATDAQLTVGVNRLQTSLAVPLSAGSTTMTVTDASSIPANVQLTIDTEIVEVTAPPTGNQVAISRGFDGTAAAAHLTGTPVSGFINAWHHNALASEIKAIENALGPNLSHLAASPWVVAAGFNFATQSPGGSLVVGNNPITLSPVPLGVNGVDAGHYVYISGGTGTAEAALITGGSAVGGAPSGTLIIQCANTHSGAWTISSATGGVQEAVSSLPATGGCIVIASSLTLLANVSDMGKAAVVVIRLPGAVVTGGFTILLGSYSQYTRYQVFNNAPNFATINTLWNGTQFDIGGFPDGRQFNFTTGPAVQALVGSINVETGALNTSFNAGVSGYARTSKQSQDVVGVFGSGVCAGPLTQAWGANIVIAHDAGNISGSNLVGVEIDTNHSASGANAAATIIGLSIVGNHVTSPVGATYAAKVSRASTSAAPFTVALDVEDGAAVIGLSVGANHETNPDVASQIFQFVARTSGGATLASSMFLDSTDTLWLRASHAALGVIALDPGGTGASSFNVRPDFNQSNVPLRSLPISVLALPTTPIEGMIQAVTDSPVNTWGAAYTGGTGAFPVLLYFNGSAWTVMAK